MRNAQTAKLTTESLNVPGIKVVDEIPDGARLAVTTLFYPDKIDKLRERVSELSPRENFVVGPTGDSELAVCIYRLRKESTK